MLRVDPCFTSPQTFNIPNWQPTKDKLEVYNLPHRLKEGIKTAATE